MFERGDIITTRRYAGETYSFKFNETIGWTNGEKRQYISCRTPENAFGYPDTVLVDFGAWEAENGRRVYAPRAYTLHRNLPRWILKRIEKTILDLTAKYIDGTEAA